MATDQGRQCFLPAAAGWRCRRTGANDLRVPPNITLAHLPKYSPELNAIEKAWQYLRDRYLSGRLFAGEQVTSHPYRSTDLPTRREFHSPVPTAPPISRRKL